MTQKLKLFLFETPFGQISVQAESLRVAQAKIKSLCKELEGHYERIQKTFAEHGATFATDTNLH